MKKKHWILEETITVLKYIVFNSSKGTNLLEYTVLSTKVVSAECDVRSESALQSVTEVNEYRELSVKSSLYSLPRWTLPLGQ